MVDAIRVGFRKCSDISVLGFWGICGKKHTGGKTFLY